jgi:hypothetical protein
VCTPRQDLRAQKGAVSLEFAFTLLCVAGPRIVHAQQAFAASGGGQGPSLCVPPFECNGALAPRLPS